MKKYKETNCVKTFVCTARKLMAKEKKQTSNDFCLFLESVQVEKKSSFWTIWYCKTCQLNFNSTQSNKKNTAAKINLYYDNEYFYVHFDDRYLTTIKFILRACDYVTMKKKTCYENGIQIVYFTSYFLHIWLV